jgi:DNA-binding XRE family transcriptional regulator
MKTRNNVKQIREAKMIGKSELAKLAGVSPLTIDRMKKGIALPHRESAENSFGIGVKAHTKATGVS